MAENETPAFLQPDQILPDYLTNPNAILNDTGVKWRYGSAPDYSKTRKVYEETRSMNHASGSLPSLVENLVKNWEVEASFKPELKDWRTIDSDNYSFAINGGEPQTAEHMLRVGTYNAIIAPNDYYSPANSDFASSHKTFKRMMPAFAWEVLEVYSGPPHVSFRWRHWGTMKNDYTGFNDKGEKITAKAHGGQIDIQGVTVATVDEKVRLQRVETWFDPMAMFRQIAPHGIVNRQIVAEKAGRDKASDAPLKQESGTVRGDEEERSVLDTVDPACEAKEGIPAEVNRFPEKGADEISQASGLSDSSSWTRISEPAAADQQPNEDTIAPMAIELPPSDVPEDPAASTAFTSSEAAEGLEMAETAEKGREDTVTLEGNPKEYEEMVEQLEASKADGLQPASGEGFFLTGPNADTSKEVEQAVMPGPGEAVVAAALSGEVQRTHEEMSRVTAMECPFLMNQE